MSSHWYPGHMAKAKQTIKENLKNVDVVIEVRDARLPDSSGNPDIHHLLRDKPSVLVLNKADLADSYLTKLWEKHYEHQGREVAIMNSLKGQGKNNLLEKIKDISSSKFSAMKLKGRRMRAVRLMVIGIPNVGSPPPSLSRSETDRPATEPIQFAFLSKRAVTSCGKRMA